MFGPPKKVATALATSITANSDCPPSSKPVIEVKPIVPLADRIAHMEVIKITFFVLHGTICNSSFLFPFG